LIKVLADQNLYRIEDFLPKDSNISFYDPNFGIPDLSGYDALILRTVSNLNQTTIQELPSSLKLVATASSGSDHVDIEYLKSNNIKFIDALGNNARAVAEYVITALLIWREKNKINLQDYTYGVIGVGNAGSAVSEVFNSFGLTTVLYDPPKAEKEFNFDSASLEEVLNCDILTFHVPLSRGNINSTFHWLDKEKLSNNSFKLIINASRGGVIDEKSISNAMDLGLVSDIIIDVWENEPNFDSEFAERAFIATPHIAGYSEQSKLNASKMVGEGICKFFKLNLPDTNNIYKTKDIIPSIANYSILEMLQQLHPILEYDNALRDLLNHKNKAYKFRKLRTELPFQYEYGFLNANKEILTEFEDLKKLGVKFKPS